MNFLLKTGLAAVVLSAVAAGPAQAQQMRFQGMDRNHDGVITRDEWRGNETSFWNEDWNHDGVLSGNEVRPGARRPAYDVNNNRRDWNHDGVIDQQDVLISQRFNGYDRNGDGRITLDEWRAASADTRLFYRLDDNRDRILTMSEYGSVNQSAQGGPRYQFPDLDRNRDGWIGRNEWNMDDAEFNRLDTNRDNRISRFEFQSYSNSNDSTSYRAPVRSRAMQAGYDRGLSEGRQAGREDRANGHGWDLDGQTELERADSGYSSQFGPLSDYQAGYREAFRLGYREGFGR